MMTATTVVKRFGVLVASVWMLLASAGRPVAAFSPSPTAMTRGLKVSVPAVAMTPHSNTEPTTRTSTSTLPHFWSIIMATVVIASSNPMVAKADYFPSTIFAAPTVQIAEAIKTLDMSLPSYDDVKSYKASVENVKSLSVTPPTKSSTSSTSQDKKAKINMDAEEKNSGGFNAASFLPSLGKQGPKTSPEGYTF